MKLSTRSRYGTRLMLELALAKQDGPVQIRQVAKNQEISERYLMQIVPHLKNAGLVKSVQGARGGFNLTKDPEEINLLDIVSAVEGSLSIVDCVGDPNVCDRIDSCITKDVWVEIQQAINDVLESKTLADLVDKYHASKENMGGESDSAGKD